MATTPLVRFSGSVNLKDMNHEIRISYLCTKASTGKLTLDEMCELLGYIALDPEILRLIQTEVMLRSLRR